MKNGFTLIEIIVTLMIIAIIGAIGVSNLTQIRQKASDRTLQARLTQLEIARKEFIKEYSRLEAERLWANPTDDPNSAVDTVPQNRYGLLKRYIERPQNLLSQVPPQGYEITMPATIYLPFQGERLSDNTTFSSADTY